MSEQHLLHTFDMKIEVEAVTRTILLLLFSLASKEKECKNIFVPVKEHHYLVVGYVCLHPQSFFKKLVTFHEHDLPVSFFLNLLLCRRLRGEEP